MVTVKVDNSAHVLTHLSATTDGDLISSTIANISKLEAGMKIIAEFQKSNKPINKFGIRNCVTYGR
jgi:hypothetical protein